MAENDNQLKGDFVEPLHAYRFRLTLLALGAVPIDLHAQSVTGLEMSIESRSVSSGLGRGYQLPGTITYGDLTIKRALADGSSAASLQTAMYFWSFASKALPFSLLISLLARDGSPSRSWLAFDVFPSNWKTSDFDGDSNQLMIESINLSCRFLIPFGL
jgi:phage tail-like protein